jgi:hypothetical protein
MAKKEYKLLVHQNQHGYGVSLVVTHVGTEDTVGDGFVLRTFPLMASRDDYVRELADVTGWEVDRL